MGALAIDPTAAEIHAYRERGSAEEVQAPVVFRPPREVLVAGPKPVSLPGSETGVQALRNPSSFEWRPPVYQSKSILQKKYEARLLGGGSGSGGSGGNGIMMPVDRTSSKGGGYKWNRTGSGTLVNNNNNQTGSSGPVLAVRLADSFPLRPNNSTQQNNSYPKTTPDNMALNSLYSLKDAEGFSAGAASSSMGSRSKRGGNPTAERGKEGEGGGEGGGGSVGSVGSPPTVISAITDSIAKSQGGSISTGSKMSHITSQTGKMSKTSKTSNKKTDSLGASKPKGRSNVAAATLEKASEGSNEILMKKGNLFDSFDDDETIDSRQEYSSPVLDE
jgi:hypothetical protein